MPQDDHDYFIEKIPAIRILIRDAFGPATLRRFCQDSDQFRPVQFADKANLDTMAAALIEYCRTGVKFDDLLAGIEKVNEKQYQRHYQAIYGARRIRPRAEPPDRPQPPVLGALPGWVNREDELAQFERMLAGQTPERLLRLLDDGERGKTWLLWRILYDCQQRGTPAVLLDFDDRRGSGLTGCRGIAAEARRYLGRNRAPALTAAEDEIAAGRLEPGGPDGQAALGQALVADLAALGRVALLLDTFERGCDAHPWLERWLFDPLPADLPRALVLVAGRPEPACRRFFQRPAPWRYLVAALDRLAPFSDADILHHYDQRGIQYTEAEIPLLLDLARSSPAEMARLGDQLWQARGGTW